MWTKTRMKTYTHTHIEKRRKKRKKKRPNNNLLSRARKKRKRRMQSNTDPNVKSDMNLVYTMFCKDVFCVIPCKQLVLSSFLSPSHSFSHSCCSMSLSVYLILILHCLVLDQRSNRNKTKYTHSHTKKGIIAIRRELKAIRVFRKFDSFPFSIVAPAPYLKHTVGVLRNFISCFHVWN